MNRLKFLSALSTSLLLLTTVAKAEIKADNHAMQEECQVRDRNGVNLIKAEAADGFKDNSMNSTDKEPWIWVQKGWCDKLNNWAAKDHGLKDAPQDVKDKLKDKLDFDQ